MKFICNRTELTEAINIVQKAVPSKSPTPVLEGILINTNENKIILTGNNIEIGIECTIDATVDTEGTIILNSKLFGDIIRKLTGDLVHIEINNNVTFIKCGNSKFKISGIEPDEYPEIPKFDSEFELKVSKNDFKSLIKHTIFAVGTSEIKPIFTGCLLEIEKNVLKMVAIDGFRMALKKIVSDTPFTDGEDNSIVIPSKTLNEILKLVDDSDDKITIRCAKNNICFEFDNVILTSRLLEGEFIDYNKMIPLDFKTKIKADVKELEGAVDRASLIIVNEVLKSPIIFNIVDCEIKINCESGNGKVDELVPVDMTGDDIIIGFNNKFILEALKAVTTEEVYLSFNETTSPCLISPVEGEDFKFIVLPVRLS